MTARRKARKRALDTLYEADIRAVSAAELASERFSDDDYALVIVRGVSEHQERIDEILATHAEGWTVARMPAVDRAVLRMCVFEMLWGDGVDDAVAISEAVALVSDLSTDESPSFVNGLLGRIEEIKPRLVL